MKEISSMDFPQHGEVFYFYGQALSGIIIIGPQIKYKRTRAKTK
jgi:hypothetical protein